MKVLKKTTGFASDACLCYFNCIDLKDQEGHEAVKVFEISDRASFSLKKRDHRIEELIEEVERREMPLKSYSLIRPKMTDAQKAALIAWAERTRVRLK